MRQWPTTDGQAFVYAPFRLTVLYRSVWAIRAEGEIQIDLRSVLEAVGLGWAPVERIIKSTHGLEAAEPCFDRTARETRLVHADMLATVLSRLSPHLARRSLNPNPSFTLLMRCWRREWQDILHSDLADLAGNPRRQRQPRTAGGHK